MAETIYNYTTSTDFPDGKVNVNTFVDDIRNSPIIIALERIDQAGDNLYVVFKDVLSAGDKILLDNNTTGPAGGLIAAHVNNVTVTEALKTPAGVTYVTMQPQEFGFQLCDRDFKITTCKMAQVDAVIDTKVNTVILEEEDWNELLLANVYKDDGTNGVVPCVDQADADVNGILSIWNYRAIDQTDGTTQIKYNIRDGAIIADPSIAAVDRFKHIAYAVAAPDLGQSYYIRLFDGYIAGHPTGAIDAKSPQAKGLDPALAPGLSNVIRIYIYHPAGISHDHILRLVTYREIGTY